MHLLAIAIGMLILSFVIQSVLAKKNTMNNKPAAITEWEFPQAEEGTPHTVVFGDAWLTGPQVMWYGNYRTKKIKSKGKK